jgi:methionyl-tRNA formyltransferase
MGSESIRIVFMGTPEFAVASLEALVQSQANIVGVITAPDKPKGRGKKLGTSPVKDYARSAGLHVIQPTNLKAPEFVEELRALQADLQIVVAFRMLPEVVWAMPPRGTFNLHGSLLPQYRGAAPINWAVINGEIETGVTTFFLKHKIDTGSIIFQEKEPISSTDTVGDVYERLMRIGAQLVVKTVEVIEKGQVVAKEQLETADLKHAPKIFKEDGEIDWTWEAIRIYNLIRGLSPYPGAWTRMHGKILKIFASKIEDHQLASGHFESDGKTYIYAGTGQQSLSLTDVQLEGKKRMKVEELLKGYRWPDSSTEKSMKKDQ